MIVAGNGSIGEGNSALSIDAAALKGTVVSGDRHILDGYPSLRINAAPVAITCIPRGGRLVAGDRGVGDRNIAGVKVDIDAATVAGGCRVAGDGAAVHGEAALLAYIHAAATAIGRGCGVARNGAAVHGEARRVGLIRRADKEHTAAGAAACFITGNLSTIHGKGRAGLIGATLYTDLHAAGDRAAVQLKFAAIDGHFALNLSVTGAVSQRQRRVAADGDAAGNRLPVQAEVDLTRWYSPAPRHRLRQIIAARRIRQGIGSCPLCASSVMFVPVDISIPAADAVGMSGLRQRKRSQRRINGVIARHVQLGDLLIGEVLYFCINGFQLLLNFGRIVRRDCFWQGVNECLHSQHRRLFSKTGREVCLLRRADGTVRIHHLLTASVGADTDGFLCAFAGREVCIFRRADRTVGIDRLFLTADFADALRRSIPGRAGNKPAVLGIALLAGIPAGRPLCGRDVAAAIVMLAAFMRTA